MAGSDGLRGSSNDDGHDDIDDELWPWLRACAGVGPWSAKAMWLWYSVVTLHCSIVSNRSRCCKPHRQLIILVISPRRGTCVHSLVAGFAAAPTQGHGEEAGGDDEGHGVKTSSVVNCIEPRYAAAAACVTEVPSIEGP
jgi:hypothetical protein